MNEDLKKYQDSFVKCITQEEDFDLLSVTPVGKLNANEVINVYKNDYRIRLQEALGENYSTVWAVLGDEEFARLCQGYISLYPSTFKDLAHYGHELSHYIEKTPYIEDFPFLSELAKFEKIFWDVFHSEPLKPSVDFSSLTMEELSRSKFHFAENVYFFGWETPLYKLWQHREKGFDGVEIDLTQAQFLCLYKNSSRVSAMELTSTQMAFIKSLRKEITISQALQNIELSQKEIQSIFGFIQESCIVISASS